MSQVRVRFAPSPTGQLHVGGARTALFNWLFARHHGGAFILRIDDTDARRNDPSAVRGILSGLQWLGLDWDEGPDRGGPHAPYVQGERLEIYRSYLDRLARAGRAYPCFCTPEELEAKRESQRAAGEPIRYDRHCAGLSEAERRRLEAEGRPFVWRLRTEAEGATRIDDLIRGTVRFENEVVDDFIVWKSDGMPTYNFATVVDEIEMEITHVIRAEEHLSNTPRQCQIYEALGVQAPHFAHIPLILGEDRRKLSKRHGAQWVGELEQEGYLVEAVVNFLALLGWAYDDRHELFSSRELIERFSLEKVSKSPAIFDYKKLQWMNGHYLRELPVERLAERALPFLAREGLLQGDPSPEERARLHRVLGLLQTRVQTLAEIPARAAFFFQDEVALDPKAVRKFLERPDTPALFEFLLERLATLEPFTEERIESVFEAAREHFGKKLGDVIQPVRVAVSGTTASPPMYETLAVLGRARTCERIKAACEVALASRANAEAQ